MLPAAFRLRRSDTIATVVRTGIHFTTPYVRIHALVDPQSLNSRIACVVGRKVHSSSVQRHRYQRWLREGAAELLPHLKKAYDIVLVARSSITAVSSLAQLQETLKDIPNQLDKHSV